MEYLKFVARNRRLISNEKMRRRRKIFEKMSEEVKTRNAIQCRSHHQKVVAKYNSFDDFFKDCLISIKQGVCKINKRGRKKREDSDGGIIDQI